MAVFDQILAKLAEKADKVSVLENGIKCLSIPDCKTLTIVKLSLEDDRLFAEVRFRHESRHYVREITAEDFIFGQYVSLKDGQYGTLRKEILAVL